MSCVSASITQLKKPLIDITMSMPYTWRLEDGSLSKYEMSKVWSCVVRS